MMILMFYIVEMIYQTSDIQSSKIFRDITFEQALSISHFIQSNKKLCQFFTRFKLPWKTLRIILTVFNKISFLSLPKDRKSSSWKCRKSHKLRFPERHIRKLSPQFLVFPEENQSIGKQIHHLEDILNVSYNQHVCMHAGTPQDILKTLIEEMCEIWQQMKRKWHSKDYEWVGRFAGLNK